MGVFFLGDPPQLWLFVLVFLYNHQKRGTLKNDRAIFWFRFVSSGQEASKAAGKGKPLRYGLPLALRLRCVAGYARMLTRRSGAMINLVSQAFQHWTLEEILPWSKRTMGDGHGCPKCVYDQSVSKASTPASEKPQSEAGMLMDLPKWKRVTCTAAAMYETVPYCGNPYVV